MVKQIFRRSLSSSFIVLALAFAFAGPLNLSRATRAQQASLSTNQPINRVELHQALLDLTNPWTVMCIAAHPDDEDGTSLIVMRRKYGAHTVSLFSTFGEGGQNAIGPELYEELGAIRVRETMAAAEIQGSEPHFLGLKDFGYSKSADEAFRVWGHDEALRRTVLEIRRLRPDVIITNHSVTNNDHGHHQATARLELEAFDAAADPKRFPEQLKDGVTTWQVQRLFVRAGRGQPAAAGQNPDRQGAPESIVTIDPNELDPIRGKVYAEEALDALQKHATQGPWPKTVAQMAARFNNSSDGRLPLIRYRLTREAKNAPALNKDSHYFLDGMALDEKTATQLSAPTVDEKPLTDFVDQPRRVVDALVAASQRQVFGKEISGGVKDVLTEMRRARMLVRLYKSLAAASGVTARITAANEVLIPGDTASLELAVSNNGENAIRVSLIASGAGPDEKGRVLLSAKDHVNSVVPPGETIKIPRTLKLSDKAGFTVPHAAHLYDKEFLGTAVFAAVFVELKSVKFPLIVQRLYDVTPPVEIIDISPAPFVVTSAIAKPPGNSGLILTAGSSKLPFKIRLINHQDLAFSGELVAGDLKDKSAPRRSIELQKAQELVLTVQAPGSFSGTDFAQSGAHPIPNVISFTLLKSGSAEAVTTGRVHAVWVDAHVATHLRVGYVRGFDYSLPNALAALGVESKELTVDDVKSGDLQKYTTIIVDNRVYESQPELIAANQKLLDYAKDGGTLIVFYHKSFEWNPDERRKRPQLAPFKLILGDERITDETAPITFIEPEHPLLNTPNKIGPEDFANWIQERGLYYPKEWDSQFHALLQANDPGEAPLKGGLLVADYGRGHYIYTSMVWYRELRAGVPGAYRMFANMISYGHK
jgi:LmbE family N-acetylglucosaminyl deacetylase